MTKLIVSVNYAEYVMDEHDALAFVALMEKAEKYESKYRSDNDGGTLHFVYPQDTMRGMTTLKVMPHSLYQMAKLAGKPE